jgi:hypothetical protein
LKQPETILFPVSNLRHNLLPVQADHFFALLIVMTAMIVHDFVFVLCSLFFALDRAPTSSSYFGVPCLIFKGPS